MGEVESSELCGGEELARKLPQVVVDELQVDHPGGYGVDPGRMEQGQLQFTPIDHLPAHVQVRPKQQLLRGFIVLLNDGHSDGIAHLDHPGSLRQDIVDLHHVPGGIFRLRRLGEKGFDDGAVSGNGGLAEQKDGDGLHTLQLDGQVKGAVKSTSTGYHQARDAVVMAVLNGHQKALFDVLGLWLVCLVVQLLL